MTDRTQINIRLNAELREAIKSKAEEEGKTITDWVLDSIRASLSIPVEEKVDSTVLDLDSRIEEKLAGMLDNKLAELNGKINARLDSMLDTKLASLESAHDSLNKLCFYCFGLAFARIGRLEEIANPPAKDLPDEPITESGISQRALARRLGISHTVVGKYRDKPNFADWSKSKDPQGIAWRFKNGKYFLID